MIIPIRTDYRMARTPWVNYALVAVNVALFVLGINGSGQANSQRIHGLLLDPVTPQIYQFFTSMFLHAGWVHLLGNMLFLWVFGNAVNDRFGHVGYALFYLAGGVLACIGYIVLSGSAPVLGASGAISAVTGAYLVLLPRARVTVLALLIYVFMPMEISSIYFLMFQFIFNLIMSTNIFSGPSGGGVAYAAHSSGYVFGIVVSAGLLAIRALPRDPFDLLNLVRTWRRRYQYRRMVSQGVDPFGNIRPDLRRPTSRWVTSQVVQPPSEMQAREIQLRQDISADFSQNNMAAAAEKYLQLVQVSEDGILPRQQQLDIANYLMAAENYAAAADAYERFLSRYSGSYEHNGDIYLMLGLLYSRYLHQYDRALRYLQMAIEKVSDPNKLELAQGELRAVSKQRGQ